MKNIGVLLPKSSTHLEIGYDFFFGLKAYFADKPGFDPSFHIANIGFGIDDDLMFSETERMFLEKNVDILLVFAEHPKVDKIFPLAAQFRRVILVVNPGAKYPVDWQTPDFVVFLTMGEILSAKLAAKNAILDLGISKGINASNYYDGGYGIGDGFYLGQESAGGQVLFNFVSKHLEAEFDSKPLTDFLKETQEQVLIYSIYTGRLLPLFLDKISDFRSQAILVCSAAMLQEIIDSEFQNRFSLPEIFSATSLNPIWKNGGFQPINEYFIKEAKKDVSPFSYLGWDAGVVVHQFYTLPTTAWQERTKQLEKYALTGSRGELQFHRKTGHFIGEQYKVYFRDRHLEVMKIALKEVIKEWEQIIVSRPQPLQVGWFNTYLCS